MRIFGEIFGAYSFQTILIQIYRRHVSISRLHGILLNKKLFADYEYDGNFTNDIRDSEVVQFQSFLEREVPIRVRRRLEIRVNANIHGDHPTNEVTQLADIVRDCQAEAFRDFRLANRRDVEDVRTDTVGHSNLTANLAARQSTSINVDGQILFGDQINSDYHFNVPFERTASLWTLRQDNPSAWQEPTDLSTTTEARELLPYDSQETLWTGMDNYDPLSAFGDFSSYDEPEEGPGTNIS